MIQQHNESRIRRVQSDSDSGQATGNKAIPADIRLQNRAIILAALYPDTMLSRSDLAKLTKLSKVSTSDVVADLVRDNLVVEGGFRASLKPGKPAKIVQLNTDGFNIVGVDLSNPSRIKGIVTNLTGSIVERIEMPIDSAQALDITSVIELCHLLVGKAPSPVIGIGVATPGAVNNDGTVLKAPNLGWTDVTLGSILTNEFSLPVHVANDADSAVLAERHFAEGPSDLIVVQIERGVGAGMLISDNIVRGSGFTAGEIGHVVIQTQGPICSCGKQGCLETLISAPVLRKAISKTPERRDAILKEAGETLGKALSMPVSMTNIMDIAVSGPADVVDDVFINAVERSINDSVHSSFIGTVHVHTPTLGRDAAALGVIAAVVRNTLGVS